MFAPLWQICLAAATLIWLSVGFYRSLFSPISKIPGPRYTLFTSVYLMIQEFSGNRRDYIHELHERYGAAVRLGPNEVSFTSLEAMKEIYSSGGSGYDKTEFYTLFKQFDTRTMFSTLDKGTHSHKKRFIASQYANTNIMRSQVMSGIQGRADAFIKRCVESGRSGMDAYVYLHCYALDCASHHLFGQYGTRSIETEEGLKMMEEQSYHESLKNNLAQYYWPRLTNIFDMISPPRPSPIANEYVLDSSKKADAGEQSLIYKLQNSKDNFQQIQMAAECMDHLAAGIDTTGDALCFVMYELSRPDSWHVQESLLQEFEENKGRPLDDLPYLDAVIKEGLRCFPPIPMSQPRYVPAGGKTIDGYRISGGVIVSCQAWSVHRLNNSIYVEGDKFLPGRWLDPEASLTMNRLFFSFGAGGRGCIGRHLAMAEMKCLLREVYSRFRTRIAPDMTGRMSLSDQIISSRPLDQTCKLSFEPIL